MLSFCEVPSLYEKKTSMSGCTRPTYEMSSLSKNSLFLKYPSCREMLNLSGSTQASVDRRVETRISVLEEST